MKLKENIAISESGFIFDPDSGESFSVNSAGKEIIKLLIEGMDMNSIKEKIMTNYDIDSPTFNRYIDDFAHSLRRFNILEREDHEEA